MLGSSSTVRKGQATASSASGKEPVRDALRGTTETLRVPIREPHLGTRHH